VRIALVSNTLPPEGKGGAEAYVAELAAALASRHEVIVLTGAREGDVEGVRIARLPGLGGLEHDAPAVRKALWHARDQWLPSVHRAARRELRSFAPDVVHTHAVQGLSAGVFTAIASEGLRHVHTAHDLGLLCMRVTMTRELEFCGGRCLSCRPQRLIRARAAARRLDLLVAPSDHVRRRHVDAGVVPEKRSLTIRQGTAAASGGAREPAAGGLHVGYIGTLAAIKGVPTLLEAFADGPPGWRLTIAGSGALEADVRAAAAADPRIEFLGRVDGEGKEAFFAGIDTLVVPSEWEENAPLVLVEAAIRGIPAVVSDRGGLPETAEARVFAARDPVALRETIAALAERPDNVREASKRLLERRDELGWETHVERVEAVLVEVAGRAYEPSASAR
jgi:glycosyltransferase involved in cell wall biosynthesis